MLHWATCQRTQDGFRNLLKEAELKAGEKQKKNIYWKKYEKGSHHVLTPRLVCRHFRSLTVNKGCNIFSNIWKALRAGFDRYASWGLFGINDWFGFFVFDMFERNAASRCLLQGRKWTSAVETVWFTAHLSVLKSRCSSFPVNVFIQVTQH